MIYTEDVKANENGFLPFYWGASRSIQKLDGSRLTVDEAIRAADLDFEVALCPSGAILDTPGGEIFIPDETGFKTVRTDVQKVLGSVGSRYHVLQTREAFDFVSDIIDSGEATIEVAGSVKNGAKMFIVCGLMGTGMQVAGVEENVKMYLTLINDFTGGQSVTGLISPIRPECNNMLSYAMKNAVRTFKVRHTASMKDRLAIQSGREALGLTVKYAAEFERSMKKLLETKVSEGDFNKFLNDLVPIPANELVKDGRKNPALTRAIERQEHIREVYMTADNIDNIRGTQYGVLNAVSEWYQHNVEGRTSRGGNAEQVKAENRFIRLTGETGLDHKAWELLTV